MVGVTRHTRESGYSLFMVGGAQDGLVRIAAAVPPVRVADFTFNSEQTLVLWRQAHAEGVAVAIFPELGLSSYTAGDLHMDGRALAAAREALAWLLEAGEREALETVAYIGMPLFVHPGIYNCAIAIQRGVILGVVPKTYLPNYNEFYERRQFRDGRSVRPGTTIQLCRPDRAVWSRPAARS